MVLANLKPWGYEYVLYENPNVSVWCLTIMPGQETSFHSHPNKKTGLVVLDGAAKVSFLSNEQKLFAGEKTMIRHGVFHKTKNMCAVPLVLLEIETPVKKEDIVRLKDKYGRAGTPYGGEDLIKVEEIKLDGKIGFSELKFGKSGQVGDVLLLTDGKITSNQNGQVFDVCAPGDVLSWDNLEKFRENFECNNLEGIFVTCKI